MRKLTEAQAKLANLSRQKSALEDEKHTQDAMKFIKEAIDSAKKELEKAQHKRNQYAGTRRHRRKHRKTLRRK